MTRTAAKVVNYVGLAGLVASFFSIIYAYSRQTVRAVPRRLPAAASLSVTNRARRPTSR